MGLLTAVQNCGAGRTRLMVIRTIKDITLSTSTKMLFSRGMCYIFVDSSHLYRDCAAHAQQKAILAAASPHWAAQKGES